MHSFGWFGQVWERTHMTTKRGIDIDTGTRAISNRLLALAMLAMAAMAACPAGTTGFNCVDCPAGCDTCDTSVAICDACSTGYYLSSSLCTACPNNCLQCQTPTVCLSCTPGYDTLTNASGNEECEFNWWKWFLIIFGTFLAIFLVGLAFWLIRQKLNEEDNENKQIEYEMRHENTDDNVQQA